MADKKEKKEKKGGGKKLIIIIIIVVLLLCLGGGYFDYNMFFKNKGKTSNTKINQQSAQGLVSSQTFPLSEFLVNLADTSGNRYLKITIFLGYDNKNLATELTTKTPMIRDIIINILRTKKASDMTSKGVDAVKAEIIKQVNTILDTGQINNVYVNDILVQ
jgi:flagellar FliL protein